VSGPSELDWAAVRAERDTLRERLAKREKELDAARARRDELAGICHRAHEAAGMRPEQPWSAIPAVMAFHRARSEGRPL
jgi:hypothetical protein